MIEVGKQIWDGSNWAPIREIVADGEERYAVVTREHSPSFPIRIPFGSLTVDWASGRIRTTFTLFEAARYGMTPEAYSSLCAAEGMGQMRHAYISDPEAYAMICSCTDDYSWLPGGWERWQEWKSKSFLYADR